MTTTRPTSGKATPIEAVQWMPAERLGQSTMEARVRSWLIGKGLLTQRM